MTKIFLLLVVLVSGCLNDYMGACARMCYPAPVLRFENGSCFCAQKVEAPLPAAPSVPR